MKYKVLIYKNNKFLAEKNLKKFEENNYIYKWSNVESGSYFFEIKDENDDIIWDSSKRDFKYKNIIDEIRKARKKYQMKKVAKKNKTNNKHT